MKKIKSLNRKEKVAVFIAVALVFVFVLIPTFDFGDTFKGNMKENKISSEDDSGLIIKDIEVGDGKEAVAGDMLKMHYIGTLEDGTVFDSSENKDPFIFVIGAGKVIKGWDEGILGMKVGGTRTLTIPPEYGYGANPIGPIPPNSTLLFEVRLLEVLKQNTN